MNSKGTVYVIAAASGTGKTSLVSALAASLDDVMISISHTTRVMRPGEQDGINYFFVDEIKFKQMIQAKQFLEYAKVLGFGNYYGTSQQWVEQQLNNSIDVILEIDWQGAAQIKRLMPHSISIFILPPSINELRERLQQRKQDNASAITQRLATASNEISHCTAFDYIVINDNFDAALSDIRSIIRSRHLLKDSQLLKQQKLLVELIAKR